MAKIAAVSCAWLSLLAGAAAHAGDPAAQVSLNISVQPLRAALKELSDQAGVQLLLRVDNIAVDAVMTPTINGKLTVEDALDRLLQNSGLEYEFVSDRLVRIAPHSDSMRTSWTGFTRLAQAGNAATSNSALLEQENAPGAASPAAGLEEIIVTARRREESVQTTPIAITAVTQKTIDETTFALWPICSIPCRP